MSREGKVLEVMWLEGERAGFTDTIVEDSGVAFAYPDTVTPSMSFDEAKRTAKRNRAADAEREADVALEKKVAESRRVESEAIPGQKYAKEGHRIIARQEDDRKIYILDRYRLADMTEGYAILTYDKKKKETNEYEAPVEDERLQEFGGKRISEAEAKAKFAERMIRGKSATETQTRQTQEYNRLSSSVEAEYGFKVKEVKPDRITDDLVLVDFRTDIPIEKLGSASSSGDLGGCFTAGDVRMIK